MTDNEKVLMNVDANIKRKATDISDKTELTVPQVTTILNQMVEDGVVTAHKEENEAYLTYTLK